MFERFTERSRAVVVFAQEEARSLKHPCIGTEHILLGLIREEEGLAARVLASFDVTLDAVRGFITPSGESSDPVPDGQIPFTPRGKKALERALREALSLGHNYIGTEHILLGLIREHEGVASHILFTRYDLDSERVREEVIRALSGKRSVDPPTAWEPILPPPRFRGVEYLKVLRVVTAEGDGVNGDPVREVARYFAEDGTLLWTADPLWTQAPVV